jgi:hypothetical protein
VENAVLDGDVRPPRARSARRTRSRAMTSCRSSHLSVA